MRLAFKGKRDFACFYFLIPSLPQSHAFEALILQIVIWRIAKPYKFQSSHSMAIVRKIVARHRPLWPIFIIE